MISDAANIVHVESHVLRYWEDELELEYPRAMRWDTGIIRRKNIAEFQRIKELKEQGYQLKAIRMIVHNGPIEGLTAEAPIPAGQAPLSAGAAAAIPQPVLQTVGTAAERHSRCSNPCSRYNRSRRSRQQWHSRCSPLHPSKFPVKTTAESRRAF